MSDAIIGTGILLKAGDGGTPEAFTSIAELVSLTPGSKTRNVIDVSNHNEGVSANILGMLRNGPVKAVMNWLPTDVTHTLLETDMDANTERNYRITYPPSGLPYDTFAARISSIEPPEVTVDAAMQITCTFELSAAPVRTYS